MLSGFHSRFESVGENKYFCIYREPDPSFPAHFDKKKYKDFVSLLVFLFT